MRSFLDKAFGADLGAMSALVSSAPVMQQELGFSPATLEWELFAQSGDGAVELMRVSDDVSTTTPRPRPTSWWAQRAAYIRSPASSWGAGSTETSRS